MGALHDSFGRRIQQLRKVKGLTQEQLGKDAAMSPKVIGEIERGRRNLTLDSVERLINALGVEPFEVFLFSLKDSKVAGKLDEKALLKIIRDTDNALHPLIVTLLQGILGWHQGKKR